MRGLLLAFSLGVVMLQQRASLPSPWQAAYALIPVLLALACAAYSHRTVGARRDIVRSAALVMAAFSIAMAGFFYAAWRAETRLADALPPAWEGQDIRLVGVVDDLRLLRQHLDEAVPGLRATVQALERADGFDATLVGVERTLVRERRLRRVADLRLVGVGEL